ncbi:MAG TPA: ATP-binding protein, partial [Anaerolineaceae bacterium]|nr:ATP-binding protein [Anaerolineaceae bacterium]
GQLLDTPNRFGVGAASELYAYLDEQILALSHQHDRLALTNLGRGRGLNFAANQPHPAALLAVALRHENRFYGTLWVAYDQSRSFSDEDTRFLVTLGGEAALAAANARLYASAEIGRQRVEAILASTPDPVLVTDQQNRLLMTNPAALQLPGLTSISNQRRPPIEEVISQNDLLGLLRSVADTQPSREIAFSNGKIYFATVSNVGVDSQTVGKVCILRDITHYKELDALKSDFVATVSHDLRSPLTLMRGYATMLQMVGDLNEQQKSYVRKIISGVESMARLVNNLLDLGRIEAGVGLQLELVAAKDVVERVTSSLQLQAAQKNIQLSQDLPVDSGPVIEADPALLQQALYNLVENAIKYTPVGGQVQVRIQARPETVLFDVRDTGIGIAPLDQPRLFEKFYRGGQREAYQQRGSGLGLAIVKSIAERHGGRVWVESYLGKGSTFYLEVPFNHKQKRSG